MLTPFASKVGDRIAEQLMTRRAMLPAIGVLLATDVSLSLLRGVSVVQFSTALAAALPIGTVITVVILIAALRIIGAPVVRAMLSWLRIQVGYVAFRITGFDLLDSASEEADRRRSIDPAYVSASELHQIALADQNALLLEHVRARLTARDERDGIENDCVLVAALLLVECTLHSPTLVGVLSAALAAQGWTQAMYGVVAVALALLWLGTGPAPIFDDRLYWPDRAGRLNALRARAIAPRTGAGRDELSAG